MSLKIYDENTLMVIDEKGRVKILTTPFQVKALNSVDSIKEGVVVYVEAVGVHPEHRIVYRILKNWHAYHDFILIIRF